MESRCEMNYQESRDYINKIEKYGSVLGLENIFNLMKRLGNPQDKLRVVHFAGTNGKGSTITYTESIIRMAGYKVGKYTSPAVFNNREVFQIDGEYISDRKYAECVTEVKIAADSMIREGLSHPTAFEVETAMAFLYFYKEKCDIVLLETGMGGETDATNVVKKVLCSVITSVSLDHMSFLGNSLEEIAVVKAGIIKEGCPVILSRQGDRVSKSVKQVAKKKHAIVIVPNEPKNVRVDKDMFTVFDYECEGIVEVEHSGENSIEKIVIADSITFCNIRTKMLGVFQPSNAATAIEVTRILENKGFHLKKSIKAGIQNAKISGRFEAISLSPLFIIDGAHNPGAAEELKQSLEMYFTNRKIAFIMGVLADKNYDKIAEITAPLADSIITITPNNPRALEAEKLCETVRKYNSNVTAATSIESALAKSLIKVKNGSADMIVAFGSLSFLGEVKSIIR